MASCAMCDVDLRHVGKPIYIPVYDPVAVTDYYEDDCGYYDLPVIKTVTVCSSDCMQLYYKLDRLRKEVEVLNQLT